MKVELWVYPPDSTEPVLWGRYKDADYYPAWFIALVHARNLWPLWANPKEAEGVFLADRWVFYPPRPELPILELRFKEVE